MRQVRDLRWASAMTTACRAAPRRRGVSLENGPLAHGGHGRAELALPDTFWARFASELWNRRPVVVESPFAGALPTSDQLFRVAADASDAYRAKGAQGATLRLFQEHERPSAAGGSYAAGIQIPIGELPQHGDRNFTSYARRFRREHPGARSALVIDGIHGHSWDLWRRMRTFLPPFFRALGVPPGGSDLDLFAGDYGCSPFGVHKDRQHVFTFVIEGTKRFLLWPLEYFESRRGIQASAAHMNVVLPLTRAEYEQAIPDATVLVAHAGDMIYWPESYWHVALGDGGMATTLAWGFVTSTSILDRDWTRISSGGPAPSTLDAAAVLRDGAAPLPRQIDQRIAAACTRGPASGARQDAELAWLRFSTALGALNMPPPIPFDPLTDDARVRGVPGSPIAWTPVARGSCAFAANGHATDLSGDRATLTRVLDVFRRINAGGEHTVDALLAPFRGPHLGARDAAREQLDLLGAWRALERC